MQNLEALLPTGDHMAVIVDDLPVVWDFRPNLVPVGRLEETNMLIITVVLAC